MWPYLFNLSLLDFFQGDSDLLRLQFGCLLLLKEDTGAQFTHLSFTQNQIAFSFFNSLASSPSLRSFIFPRAGMKHPTHTSLNSKQPPSTPFKRTGFVHGGAWRLIFLWLAYLPPPTRCHHLHSTGSVSVGFPLCVNKRINAGMGNLCYCDTGPASPQIWRSICRLWFHIGFVWSCVVSFDLAIQQRGNNG